MKSLSFLLLALLALAGCADESPRADETSPNLPVDIEAAPKFQPASRIGWQLNETLSAVDCHAATFSVAGGDADWIRRQLPPGMTLTGTLAQVHFILEQCASHAIGNRSVVADANLFLAYVMVEHATDRGAESVAFPLEMSTNHEEMGAALRTWGIYSANVTITNADGSDGPTKRVTGTTESYEFTFTPAFPQQFQPPAFALQILGDSNVTLDFRQARVIDQFPMPCLASFASGRLAEAFSQSMPCTFTGGVMSETIEPSLIR